MKRQIFLFLLIIGIFCSSAYPQGFNTKYNVEMRFKQKGANFSYYEESNQLTIENGQASLKIDFKMKDPKTAATNSVHVKGSASGTFTDNSLRLTGSGTISTYERGVKDDDMSFELDMRGTGKTENNRPVITGTFNFNQDGEMIIGSFKAEGKYLHKLEIVRGSCKILKNNSSEWVEAKNNQDFEFGDFIETSGDTRVNIVFPDGTEFKVKSNTRIELLSPDQIKLQYGEVFYLIQKMGKDFQVVCPSSVTSCLGTKFIVSVDKDGNSYVNLLEGKVRVKDNNGKEIILDESGSVKVDNKKGLGEVKKINTSDVKKQFESSDKVELTGNKNESSGKNNDGLFKSGNTKIIIIIIIIVIVIIVFVAIAVIILVIVLKGKKRKV